MAEQIKAAPVLLRRKQVEERTGLSRTSIYDKIKANEFPAQIRLSEHSVAWVSSEIDAWIDAQIKKSRAAKVAA